MATEYNRALLACQIAWPFQNSCSLVLFLFGCFGFSSLWYNYKQLCKTRMAFYRLRYLIWHVAPALWIIYIKVQDTVESLFCFKEHIKGT